MSPFSVPKPSDVILCKYPPSNLKCRQESGRFHARWIRIMRCQKEANLAVLNVTKISASPDTKSSSCSRHSTDPTTYPLPQAEEFCERSSTIWACATPWRWGARWPWDTTVNAFVATDDFVKWIDAIAPRPIRRTTARCYSEIGIIPWQRLIDTVCEIVIRPFTVVITVMIQNYFLSLS
jgi:hypothetical protein